VSPRQRPNEPTVTLHVEAELDDVAVLDDVLLAFDAEFAGFAGFGWKAMVSAAMKQFRGLLLSEKRH